MYFKSEFDSPIGKLPIYSSEDSLIALIWEKDSEKRVKLPQNFIETENEILTKTKKQLEEYFLSKRTEFTIPIKINGTEFQLNVWNELLKIKFSELKTYSAIANHLNKPNASRAAGAAIGKNPISILIPCHRVLGMNGSLTGFAGGLEAKKFLVNHEAKLNPEFLF